MNYFFRQHCFYALLAVLIALPATSAVHPASSGTSLTETHGFSAGISVYLRDGGRIERHLEAPGDRFIVELKGTPILAVDSQHRAAERKSATAMLDQLETDLRTLSRTSKTEAAPVIHHRYSMTFLGVAARVPPSMIESVRRLPYVKSVSSERTVHELLSGSVPQIHADQVWSQMGTRGRGAVVAVIDTGINYQHPSLGSGFGPGFKVSGGYDFVNGDADPMDDNGHGTHVAGIIAADSDVVRGVAPEVSLLAYKVLDATGGGYEGDIIAAIEASVDPNGDGNPSDAADVVNMSLGGDPRADDPIVRAVETAFVAGVTFSVAAGNNGSIEGIGSPGTAPSAITVGAVDRNDDLAPFSSKGPVLPDLLIKPEVVAPGVEIRSTFHGGIEVLSGTSMAAPHVAGVAALLKSLHPDWTPSAIKSAIVGTAADLGLDVMAQGAGRVDALAAANATLVSEPPAVSFGLAEIGTAWTRTQSIVITNRGPSAVALSGSVQNAFAEVTVVVEPAALRLQPNESGVIHLTVSLAQRARPSPRTESSAIAGALSLSGSTASLRIPWSFVYAVRVSASFEGRAPLLLLSNEDRAVVALGSYDPSVTEKLVPPGTYDVLVVPGPSTDEPPTLILREATVIDRTTSFAFQRADAPYTLQLESTDDRGTQLSTIPSSPLTNYLAELHVLYPEESKLVRAGVRTPSNRIALSKMSDRFTLWPTEHYFDLGNDSVYALQHHTLAGISQNQVRRLGVGDLLRQDVEVRLDSGPGNSSVWLSAVDSNIPSGFDFGFARAKSLPAGSRDWTGHAFLTEQTHPDNVFGSQFFASRNGDTRFNLQAMYVESPILHTNNRKVAGFTGRGPSPATWFPSPGERLFAGELPVHPRTLYHVDETQIELTQMLFGPIEDRRPLDSTVARCRAFDAWGEIPCKQDEWWKSRFVASVPGRGRYSVQIDDAGLKPLNATGTLVNELDTSKEDSIPPSFTSLALYDGERILESKIIKGRPGKLRFSAADFERLDPTSVYRAIPTDLVRAFYRETGTEAWVVVPLLLTAEENESAKTLGRLPIGKLFEADLTEAARVPGWIDIKLMIEDAAGNTADWTLAPAFQVYEEHRKRPVRR